jgi:hypothetical protein
VWQAPGNVAIEEGLPPHLAGLAQPARVKPQPSREDYPEQTFAPAPPAEPRRGARPMPDIEEFPMVGQREYRARKQMDAPQPEPDAGRGWGLINRITGRRRHGEGPERGSDPAVAAGSSQAGSHSPERHRQEAEFPRFFNKDRR